MSIDMQKPETTVKVSSKYQIAIPLAVREAAQIEPGAEYEIEISGGGLRLIPVKPLASLRGTVRRDDAIPLREKEDPE
jgi:AbrB family looped-hinge helix DNA binding protein